MFGRVLGRNAGGWLYGLVGALGLGLVLVVILGMGMRKIVNHDEHQFVAAGALIARQGLLPYLDFPYFHVPGLAFVYAALFQVTDRLLLAARGLAVAASWLMLVMLFLAPVGLLGRKPGLHTALSGGLVVLLFISTQTFRYTTGWAWNHDVPVLLMLIACWLQMRALRTPSPAHPQKSHSQTPLAVGLLMGGAVALRASFALPALVFGLFWLPVGVLQPGKQGDGARAWRPLLWCVLGGLVSTAPVWIFLLLAPAEFLFGNLEYVRLNTAHYLETGGLARGEGWRQKWEMTRDTMFLVWRANAALVILTLVQAVRLQQQVRLRHAPDLVFLATLIPAALLSGYAPTPMQIQYIYLVFPLLALLNLALLAHEARPTLGIVLLLVAALYGANQAWPDFRDSWRAAWQPATWTPNRVHEQGMYIAEQAQAVAERSSQELDSVVITLSPIYPLEGGAAIVPGLVSGPFGWRVANLIDPATRAARGIVGPEEMAQQMAAQTPAAILVGIHGAHAELEPSLIEFAQSRGYMPVAVEGFAPQPGTLWLVPP